VFTGSVETVRARLDPLIDATKADEVMVTTMIYDHGARRHSYEVLAQAFGLPGTVAREKAEAGG
jgi:alkanesulfonate monooxygenase SsuD/methylene tetrahydromethanopterin reductase-like flavin-dependent oxidoreductase (luciferase family)